LLIIEREQNELVCSVFGVPLGLVLGTTSGGASNLSVKSYDLAYRNFTRGVDTVGQMLARVAEQVHVLIYGEGAVDVSFPFLPVTSIEELETLGTLGLISRESLARRMLNAIGLPVTDMALQNAAQTLKMTKEEHKKNNNLK
jgi:hypothetical protein